MRVDMIARRDGGAGKADDLAVLCDWRTFGHGREGDLVAEGDVFGRDDRNCAVE